ncbi:hypothetical protein [Methylobacterium sp. CM6257]
MPERLPSAIGFIEDTLQIALDLRDDVDGLALFYAEPNEFERHGEGEHAKWQVLNLVPGTERHWS